MKVCDSYKLCTPGPVNVPSRILLASARPMIHHRTKEFEDIVEDVITKLRKFFDTETMPLLVHTTGRGALEGTVINLFSAGDEIISVTNGKFGRMYAEIAEAYGLKVHCVATDDDQALCIEELEKTLAEHPAVKAVSFCHGDTSTGRKIDLDTMGDLGKKYGILTIADAVCTAGCERIDFDKCGVDVVVTCTQKGFMCPTGMSIVLMSSRAWDAAEHSTLPHYYVNFRSIHKNLSSKYETPGSTPVSLVLALRESLKMLDEEGRDNVFDRHEKLASAVRAALKEMGLTLFLQDGSLFADCMTAFYPPEGTNPAGIKKMLADEFGLVIAAGIGNQSGKILRLAHMGAVYPQDMLTVVAALEAVLYKLTGKIPGAGVKAFTEELNR